MTSSPPRTDARLLPEIIQGGMGVAISDWRLARATARAGALGVVSGTALDQVLARRLQDGDPSGEIRRAFEAFPEPAVAQRVWQRFFIEGGKAPHAAYATLPLLDETPTRDQLQLCVVANFVEVWLARRGHQGPIGINYLEKIQIPHLPSIYGALLAGVDVVLMGAGIPLKVPGAIDALVVHAPATYPLTVTGLPPGETVSLHFDPREVIADGLAPLRRPAYLPIVRSPSLANTLWHMATGCVAGCVVEGPTAGGHNAPPRGRLQIDARGEPVYGPRDVVDPAAFSALGVPFWLAGGYGAPGRLADARAAGAAGIQVGTAFALCDESGLRDDLRQALRDRLQSQELEVRTDPLASPTGYPFKVVQLPGTIADEQTYAARPRICDLGYLREAYRTPDGTVGFRCAAEPVSLYVHKGGHEPDTAGRRCICNALIASAGLPQVRAGHLVEAPIVTAGDGAAAAVALLEPPSACGSAEDVVRRLSGLPSSAES